MSLAEWTAASMRPASSASSISFTKTPRSPISPNGFERSRSPAVVIGTRATSTSAYAARSASAASSAWMRASLLPRLPRRTIALLEPEEVTHGVRIEHTVGRGRRLLHAHRRLVQELRHDLARQRLDCAPLARRERGQPSLDAVELLLANRLGPRPQRGDRRHDVERELPRAEAVGFLGHDRLGPHGLLAPPGDTLGHDPLEVVDVVEVAALELVDGGIEVARNSDVDKEDRATATL